MIGKLTFFPDNDFYFCISVIPLLQVAFLSLFLAPENTSISKFAVAIGTVRALRQVKKASFKYRQLVLC